MLTPDQLLLTPTRAAQLTAALSNLTVPVPLESVIAEADADVSRLTQGYVIEQLSKDGWTRSLALFKAYGLVGPVPQDIETQYRAAMEELTAIARGERKNLQRETENESAPSSGAWGSSDKII